MSKRFKVLIAVLAATLLVVGTATSVVAQEENSVSEPQDGVRATLITRVAEILNISPEDLTNAFNQARQEYQATGNCTLRQEQINQFRERQTEKQQEWVEKKQEQMNRFQNRWIEKQQNWVEKRQALGKRSQNNITGRQDTTDLSISPSV